MPSFGQRLEAELGPAWGAVVGALGALYGIWPVLSLHDTLVIKGKGGVGWFAMIIFGFIAFVATLAIAASLLGLVFHRLENQATRGLISLALVALFVAAHGLPHPLWLALIAVVSASSYFQCRKAQADAHDREEFFNG